MDHVKESICWPFFFISGQQHDGWSDRPGRRRLYLLLFKLRLKLHFCAKPSKIFRHIAQQISSKDHPLPSNKYPCPIDLEPMTPLICCLSHTLWYDLCSAVENMLYIVHTLSITWPLLGITLYGVCKARGNNILFQTWRNMMTLNPNLRKIICLVTVDFVCLLLVGVPCLLLWLVGKWLVLQGNRILKSLIRRPVLPWILLWRWNSAAPLQRLHCSNMGAHCCQLRTANYCVQVVGLQNWKKEKTLFFQSCWNEQTEEKCHLQLDAILEVI